MLLGASATPADIENLFLNGEIPSLDWRVLAASVVIFVVSLVLSQFFKRREKGDEVDTLPGDEVPPMATQPTSSD